jgi:parvulin-like peptidyl-prolyl isomerase
MMRPMLFRYRLLALLALCACRQGTSSDSQVLARVGNLTVTAKDLQLQAPRLAQAIRDETSQVPVEISKRIILLNKLMEEAVLLTEAGRRGYDKEPAVVQNLMNRVLEVDVLAEDKAIPVSDADVARYYDDHLAGLIRPEVVRVLQIVVRDRSKAEQVWHRARGLDKTDLTAFQQLSAEYSEDPTSRMMGGDLGFFDFHSNRYPKPVVDAAFALPGLFEVSAPVESAQGFHLLKLVQRLPAYVPRLAEAAPGIRAKLRWLLIERKKYAWGKQYLSRAAPDVDLSVLIKVPLPDGIFD